MNDEEILIKVKSLLGLGTNTAQDDVLRELMSVVKDDMVESGVKETVVNSKSAVGTILRGIIDNWNYGIGADYSQMYINGVIKLREKKESGSNEL